ncbi:MAG: hypothetical protein ACYC4H_00675 [Desulfocucumaceae bacterium]
MAVSLRDRPVLRGKDAKNFLSEEKKINESRAQLQKEDGQVRQVTSNKKTVRLCVVK